MTSSGLFAVVLGLGIAESAMPAVFDGWGYEGRMLGTWVLIVAMTFELLTGQVEEATAASLRFGTSSKIKQSAGLIVNI